VDFRIQPAGRQVSRRQRGRFYASRMRGTIKRMATTKSGADNPVYVFIDASNMWEAQKAKGRFFDLEGLAKYLQKQFSATDLKVFYYTAYPADGTRAYDLKGRHRFYTYLKKGLGFVVRKKPLKRISVISANGEAFQEKGNMDVEITIDAIHHRDKYQTAIFFTGDSDFLALISYLRQRGKKVFVYSSRNNVSRELRTGADGYVDVLDLEDGIWGRPLEFRK